MRIILVMAVLAVAGGRPGEDLEGIGREVVEAVRDHFYDAARGRAWAEAHAGYAAGLEDREEFARRTNQLLAELKASHTRYLTPMDVDYYGLRAIFAADGEAVEYDSIGVDLTERGFVRVVFAGGPADRAGLRRGDEIVAADGKAFHPVRSFEGRAGQAVLLSVRRQAGEKAMEVPVTPRRINPKVEWLEAQRNGTRIVERGGKRVAYVPMYSGAGEAFETELRDAATGPLREEADALVIDFRDGWGGCDTSFLDLFNPLTPVLGMTGRDGKGGAYVRTWRKPLVVLVNGGSRSGKEVVAWALKRRQAGTIVGQRTAGAVLGGRPFRLSDGSVLYLAASDIAVDGERLEGRGVEPDVAVEDRLEYAAGADPQREQALDVAAAKARAEGP